MNKRLVIFFVLIISGWSANAQMPGGLGNISSFNSGGKSGSNDSLKLVHRVNDTINIYYHYLGDVTHHHLDSSLNDFYKYLPLKATDVYLGNIGNPAYSIIYQPSMQPGWDAGFHSLDAYKFNLDSTRFYNTTGPYTELRYLVGPQQEQVIDVFHTQNHHDNFNIGGHYRKINSPGYFRNQNTNDDSYDLFARYNTHNQRYNVYFSWVGNTLSTGENGGLVNDADLENPIHSDRQTINTNLGGNNAQSGNSFFSTSIPVATIYKESGVLLQNNYDWGRGDTVKVNDTTFDYHFYPVFRIQHTLELQNITASFKDTLLTQDSSEADYYGIHYGISQPQLSNILTRQQWKKLSNDFSLMQFPVPKNQAQFIKAGITYESLHGIFLQNDIRLNNLYGHFEYRNRTRNQKWDIDLVGVLYLAGNYFGNYHVNALLSRYVSRKLGNVTMAFSNVNRTPDYVYKFFQSNVFLSYNKDLRNENTTLFQFGASSKELKYSLTANYYLFTNYTYFRNYYQSAQYTTAFTLLQVKLDKQFTVNHFNLYADVVYQQLTGASPLHVPTFWTRTRLTYENDLFDYHLQLCTGFEVRYNSNYYADGYSPVLSQFIPQDTTLIKNVPELTAFVNFKIRSFTAYIRAERLNDFLYINNFAAPHYPYPDFGLRIGVKWGFIN
jgi:Putative porin